MAFGIILNRGLYALRQLFEAQALRDAEAQRHAIRETRIERLDIDLDVSAPFLVQPNHELTPREARVALQLAAADVSFAADIWEPRGNNWELIDERIRGRQGLGWSTIETGTKARPDIAYTKNGQFAWCGAEAGYCLGAAGLLASIRRQVMPSCFRLGKFCVTDDSTRSRVVEHWEDAEPGDVHIVGAKPGWTNPQTGKTATWWGSHVTTVIEVDRKRRRILCHEGNAVAEGPTGKRREGVGRQWRSVDRTAPERYATVKIYRFLDKDFAPIT